MAISYPSMVRGYSNTKTPHYNTYSLNLDRPLGTDLTDAAAGHGLETCDTRGRDARDTIVQRGAGRPRHDSATAAKPHGPRRKPHGPLALASLAGLAEMAATRWYFARLNTYFAGMTSLKFKCYEVVALVNRLAN